jgi:site-specific DNA-methyltransferase (adenine-specific)/modification methylase
MAEKVVIGNAELWHGDCREVLPLLPKHDLLLTDPPYGIEGTWNGGNSHGWGAFRGEAAEWDERPEWFAELVAKHAGQAIVWGGNYFPLQPSGSWLVWDKLAGKTPCDQSDVEMAWTNMDGPARIYTHLWRGIMRDGEENVSRSAKLHPNQKPVALLSWSLRTLGITDGLVIDPFMGSGSLGVACHRLGLHYLGIEIDPSHYATARKRLYSETAQGLIFASNSVLGRPERPNTETGCDRPQGCDK